MIFFCTLILFHHKLSTEEKLIPEEASLKNTYNVSMRHGVLFAAAGIFAEMILGAFMRHTGVGAACGVGWKSSALCMDSATWKTTLWPSLAPAQLHMSHRVLAVIIGCRLRVRT